MLENPGCALVLFSGTEPLRNNDVQHPFRQDSHFYYLTGFEEAESMLVLTPAKSGPGYRTVLFVREQNIDREIWEGERYGIERALSLFGADEAYLNTQFAEQLPKLLSGVEKVFYRLGDNEAQDRTFLEALEKQRRALGRSGRGLLPISDPNEVVGEMRLFKSAEEIEVLRRACALTAESHKHLMETVRPGMNEYEVESMVDAGFRRRGSQRLGYGSIVAGGVNATCLHYRSNNEVLRDGDLLLVDAGGELDYYTADITRTFPVGRKFSKDQAEIYDLVLKSQVGAIAMTKPGVTLSQIHQYCCTVLTEGMLSMGLLKGSLEENLRSLAYKRFYPHNTSHWLGMDVHDVGLYLISGEPRVLKEGMVFTIEPGFYVQPLTRDRAANEVLAVPERLRGIGIRIEDDVLVTATGCEVMTSGVPKAREEIEALRTF